MKALNIISIILHGFWIVLFCLIYKIGVDHQQLKEVVAGKFLVALNSVKLSNAIDSIAYAQEVGRLDIISIIMGFFGIIIAVSTVGWFAYVRNEAKQEAREEIRLHAEPIVTEYLEKHMKTDAVIQLITATINKRHNDEGIKEEYKSLASVYMQAVSDDVANKIAEGGLNAEE